MPTKIQIKRGQSANISTLTLDAGEPAFTIDTGKLYVGDGTNKVMINPVGEITGLNTADYYTKYKVNTYGQIVEQSNLTASDLPSDIPVSKITGLGTAATANTGTASGNVPVLDATGKLASSILPSIAISDVFVVASQTAMLALSAETGDVAVRTDVNKNFILKQSPASVIGNWVELLTPPDSVTSVNGNTGTVVLTSNDMVMTGYTKPASYTPITITDTSRSAIAKLEKNFESYATLLSPTFTGTPKAPTPVSTDSSTNIATTAFVTNAVAIIDGGTF